MKKLAGMLLAFFLLWTVAPNAFGQASSGELVGTVTDSAGAVVSSADVVAVNNATGVKATTKTGSSGDYRFVGLLPGRYTVSITAAGFSPQKISGILVDINKTSTSNAHLSVGSDTSVEVESESIPTLDTTSQNLTQTVSNQELSILPSATTGSGVLNASLLVPGVASSGGVGAGSGPAVGGQRPRANNFTVDGIDNNNKGVTGPLLYIPNDAVSEFTVITNQFSPEFGHSAGGQFNSTVLSGTNTIHGRLYEYFNNKDLNAMSAAQGAKLDHKLRYDFNRYGGQLGAPIIKDKLFGFVNFERQTTGQAYSNRLCMPTSAGLAALQAMSGNFNSNNLTQYLKYTPAANIEPSKSVACNAGSLTVYSDAAKTPQNARAIELSDYQVSAPFFINQNALTTSMDWTISPQDSLRVRYLYNTNTQQDNTAALPEFWTPLPARYHLISVNEFHNFTPNLINEVRLGYHRYYTDYQVGSQSFPGLDAFPNLYFYDQGFMDYGPDDNGPQSTVENMYQFVDNISYTKGKHTLKFGFEGRKYIAPQTFTQRVRGDYEWSNLTDYLHDLAPDSKGFGQRSTGNFVYYGDQTAFYGYVNDTWRATQKLTLNYGLRYEFTSVPQGMREQQLNAAASVPGLATFNAPQPQYTNFVPRFGVNYAPDDKTSIRAGFGMAMDVIYDNLGLLSLPPQYSSTNTVGDGNTNYTGAQNPGYSQPGFLAGGGLPPGNGGLATFATVADQRAATAAYLPNQKLPYAETWNLQVQRTFGKDFTLSVGYVGTRGIHLPTQVQINKRATVTASNQLPTYFTNPGYTLDATNSYYTTNTSSTVNTLGQLQGISNIVPAWEAAGFTSVVTSYQPYSQSNYNGLTANLTRRMRRGLSLDFSYTWSKTMDDATADVFSTALTPRRPQDSQNVANDYSRSALDRTHRLTLAAVYDFQLSRGHNWFVRNLAANWTLAPIYTYESPEYYTALSGYNSNLNGDSGSAIDRPLINPAGSKSQGSDVLPVYSTDATLGLPCQQQPTPTTYCDSNLIGYVAASPSAYYVAAGAGTLPTVGRNTLAGRPINNVDFSAAKQFSFTERFSFQFSAQAFNVLNHAQYVPGYLNDVASNGQTSTLNMQTVSSESFQHPENIFVNNGRTLQLAGKLIF